MYKFSFSSVAGGNTFKSLIDQYENRTHNVTVKMWSFTVKLTSQWLVMLLRDSNSNYRVMNPAYYLIILNSGTYVYDVYNERD